MTKEKISCVDCDRFRWGRYEDGCAGYLARDSVPVQGRLYPREVHDAWRRCKGRKFKPRRPWWKRLLGLA